MKFQISRAAGHIPPFDEKTYSEMAQLGQIKKLVYFIEFNSLEELMDYSDIYGELIIGRNPYCNNNNPTIMIYDGPIE